jgi:maltooligosyltrehalose trehalohydrolase
MGEEYGERSPFQYFIDHGDKGLIEAVRKGRLAEFKPFGWKNISDPYAVETFESSRLTPPEVHDDAQQRLAAWTKQLIALRKQHASLGTGVKGHQLRVWMNPSKTVLTMYRKNPQAKAMLLIFGFNDQPTTFTLSQPKGQWTLLLANSQSEYANPHDTSSLTAPATLHLTSTKHLLPVPAFSVWVYTETGFLQ